MFNESDTAAIVSEIKRIGEEFPDSAVIVFNANRLIECVKNRKHRSMKSHQNELLTEINDILSAGEVCQLLGDCYTICEFEMAKWFLISAAKAESKDFPMFGGQYDYRPNV